MPVQFQWPFKKIKQESEQRSAPGGVNIPGELLNAIVNNMDGGYNKRITKTNASTLSAVYQAITIHYNSLNIPLRVYKKLPNGDSDMVTQSDRYEFQVDYLLHTSPNLIMTPSMFIQLMETSRLLYGNGYAFINRNLVGEPTAIIWVHPDRVEIRGNAVELKYDIRNESGGGYWKQNVRSVDMIHVRATSFDGITGTSPIDIARESLEFGLNTQNAGNNFFRSGMRQAVVLTHPGTLSPTGQERLGTQFDSQLHSNKTIVLEEGVKPTTLTFSPEQSQFLTSREFSVTEIARWMNLPESMLENNARSTFSNIEHKTLWFLINNVRPRARMYEQEFDWKLLGNDPNFYTSFNLDALLRADTASRAQFYVQMVQNGIYNRDEVRSMENKNSIPDGSGKEFLTPMNLETDKERENTDKANETQTDNNTNDNTGQNTTDNNGGQ